MPTTVLIVDDSNFFQHRLREIIDEHEQLKVIGIAANGMEAIEKAKELRPDVITMDYEMPFMDGVTAVRQIMADRPTPILMFSSMTHEGAKVTLDALEAGAVDFLPKNFAEVSHNSAALKRKLHNRLIEISRPRSRAAVAPSALRTPAPSAPAAPANRGAPAKSLRGKINVLCIGASTGGPVALAEVLTKLPAHFPHPILLIQHMPENFTGPFAERLNNICKIQVRQAQDRDSLRPGLALLAPGGKQMMVDKDRRVRILAGDERVNYKPSLDITFGSAANVYGDKVLAVVLTGMGSDGCEGARLVKRRGGHIWSQDEATSVIYGMPMSVARAKLTDRVLPLEDIGRKLASEL